MKQITEIKKFKNEIKVTFDQDTFTVQPELIMKYHLAVGITLDQKTYQQFLDENHYLSALRWCLKKLKKMLTVHEMKELLAGTSYPLSVQKQVINYLIDRKYLDDLSYAKTYVELKKYQEGPEMITFKLKQKGITDLILGQLFQKSYDEFQIVYEVALAKSNKTKHKTKKQLFQTIKMQLLAKGYQQDIIEAALAKLSSHVAIDEDQLMEVMYQKIHRTYSHKYQGYELKQKMTEKLYQKGFSYERIKAFLKNK
ncbi:MAG: RecX family transcriptional regulator [Acholeplasmataceae bacterium]